MNRIFLAWALPLAMVPALLVTGSALAGAGPQFIANGQPVSARSIDFADIVTDGRVEIDLVPGPKRLQVFAPGSSIADLKPSCELPLTDPNKLVLDRTTPCELLEGLWKGESVDVLLGVEGSTAMARLAFTPPSDQGIGKTIEVEPPDKDKGTPWGKPKFPASAAVEGPACWLFLGKWFSLKCASGQDIDLGPTTDGVHEKLAANGAVPLYVFVSSGKPVWAKFELKKKPPTPPKPPEPPKPLIVSGSLEDRCKAIKPAHKEYRICVDAMASGPRPVKMFECIPADEKKNYCTEIGAVVSTNQGFRVIVWSNIDLENVQIDFSGDVGYSSGFKELPSRGEGGVKFTPAPPSRQVEDPVYDGPFAPRKNGEAKLTIKLKQKAKDNKTPPDIEITRAFLVRASYWGAARLGIGFMWTPSAKKVGTAMGANNQQYVVVTGSEPAAPQPELVGGLSYFLREGGVMEGDYSWNYAVGARVGLLSQPFQGDGLLKNIACTLEEVHGPPVPLFKRWVPEEIHLSCRQTRLDWWHASFPWTGFQAI